MLYIIRHGKTDWNNLWKIQGRTDIPLNEEGRTMAKKAAEEYKDINFDIAFSSPLIRARETAEILLKGRDIPIINDDRLMEMSFGAYEGFEKCFDSPNCPLNVFFKTPEKYVVPVEGAESMEELFKRTGEFLKEHGIRTRIRGKLSDGSDEVIRSIEAGYVSYIINTRAILSGIHYVDGAEIRRSAIMNGVTIFTSLDTVRILLDVLEDITPRISTI